MVKLAEGDNAVGWAVEGGQFPNFTLTASRMSGAGFRPYAAGCEGRARDLKVRVTPVRLIIINLPANQDVIKRNADPLTKAVTDFITQIRSDASEITENDPVGWKGR